MWPEKNRSVLPHFETNDNQGDSCEPDCRGRNKAKAWTFCFGNFFTFSWNTSMNQPGGNEGIGIDKSIEQLL